MMADRRDGLEEEEPPFIVDEGERDSTEDELMLLQDPGQFSPKFREFIDDLLKQCDLTYHVEEKKRKVWLELVIWEINIKVCIIPGSTEEEGASSPASCLGGIFRRSGQRFTLWCVAHVGCRFGGEWFSDVQQLLQPVRRSALRLADPG